MAYVHSFSFADPDHRRDFYRFTANENPAPAGFAAPTVLRLLINACHSERNAVELKNLPACGTNGLRTYPLDTTRQEKESLSTTIRDRDGIPTYIFQPPVSFPPTSILTQIHTPTSAPIIVCTPVPILRGWPCLSAEVHLRIKLRSINLDAGRSPETLEWGLLYEAHLRIKPCPRSFNVGVASVYDTLRVVEPNFFTRTDEWKPQNIRRTSNPDV